MNKNLIGFIGKIGSGKDEVSNMFNHIHETVLSKGDLSFDNYLNNKRNGEYKNVKFANELKKLIANLLGVPVEKLEDREFKNTPIKSMELKKITFGTNIEGENPATYSVNISSEFGEAKYHQKPNYSIISEEVIEVTPRWLMINIGTEAFRNIISKDWWVMQTFKNYTEESKWIISDVRFPNEADTVKHYKGLNIAIKRPFGMRFPEYAYLTNPKDIYEAPFELKSVNPKLYSEITSESEMILDDYDKWADKIIYNDTTLEFLYNQVINLYNEFYT